MLKQTTRYQKGIKHNLFPKSSSHLSYNLVKETTFILVVIITLPKGPTFAQGVILCNKQHLVRS